MPYSLDYLAQSAPNWSPTVTPPNKNDVIGLANIPEAHRPQQNGGIWSWFSDAAANASEQAKEIITNAINPDEDPAPAGSYRRQNITYQDADLAAAYGMNAATAYQEALANTAHQREVADLRAAGLNPVLSASQGRGAETVSSAEALAAPGGGSNSASAFKESLSNIKAVLSLVKTAKSIFT